ncbi:MAG TPA: FAD/NAD(P)-binding protein [Pyrinomonadaceae bacterium]|nr:FAD/NAD(P)-binding protein [Pyrinomonadaceae bacterium]
MRRITIIGGGASGTLLALNLLKYKGDQRLEINLVEKRPHIGRGVAFSTQEDTHLLNVPAAKMGAYPDDVEHFHRWLNENGLEYSPTAFVPRRIFGEYLREQLEQANQSKAENVELNIFDDEAIGLEIVESPGGNASVNERGDRAADSPNSNRPTSTRPDGRVSARKANVQLASGDHIYSEKVALAFGNFLPPHPTVPDQSFAGSPRYFQDPWTAEVFDSIKPDNAVLIVGTGLSMVDVTMQLYKLHHKGVINAISTRGQLPAVHKLGHTYPAFYDEIKGKTRVTDILKAVRAHSKKADAGGSDWRAVIDSLRPVTQQIWLDLPLAEKKYFMQHLSRYWNVARHRMAPEAALIIDELRGTGQLQILKGRLQKISWEEGIGFDVRYATIGLDQYVHADVIINCIGSESRFDQVDSRLVKNLMTAGMIQCDDLRFGLDATPDGHLKGTDGQPSDMLYTLGTALKGVLWESTAIPEIRVQASKLAQKLIAE